MLSALHPHPYSYPPKKTQNQRDTKTFLEVTDVFITLIVVMDGC